MHVKGNTPTVIFDIILKPLSSKVKIILKKILDIFVEFFTKPILKEKTCAAGNFIRDKRGYSFLPHFVNLNSLLVDPPRYFTFGGFFYWS